MTEGESSRVLVVDDDPGVLSAHARYVRALGYDVETATDGFEAMSKLALGIDLLLLDIDMPNMDGLEVVRRIRARDDEQALVPIIMVTGLDRDAWFGRALEAGANDVIGKPINADELRLRTRWLMELKAAHDRLRERNVRLSGTVDRQTEDLRAALEEMSEAKRRTYDAHLDTIRRLTIAAEYKDELTAAHIARVGLSSAVLARAVGFSHGHVEMIRHAAPMHDVGKIGIPDSVLLKRGPLDEVETAVMQAHTRIGSELLAGSDSEVMQMGQKIALCHHEHWDGTGYPQGMSGASIPVEARICAVVDFFDASTMDRPYRSARPTDQVIAHMSEEAGTHFDPAIISAFLECTPEIEGIREELPPG